MVFIVLSREILKWIKHFYAQVQKNGLFHQCGRIVLPRREGGIGAVGVLFPVLSFHGIQETDVERRTEGKTRCQTYKGEYIAERPGQFGPRTQGPGEDRYAIPISAEACVTFHVWEVLCIHLIYLIERNWWRGKLGTSIWAIAKEHEKWIPRICSRCSQHYLKDLMWCHIWFMLRRYFSTVLEADRY